MDLAFTLQSNTTTTMMIVSRRCQGPMCHVESSQHFSLWRKLARSLHSTTYAIQSDRATWYSVKHVYCNVTTANEHEAAPSNRASTPHLTILFDSMYAKEFLHISHDRDVCRVSLTHWPLQIGPRDL